jgi:DNA-binding NtrC family response regulator
VKQHGGFVTVESSLGTGSVFRAFFPLVAAQGDLPAAQKPVAESLRGGGQRILLVEDYQAVREFTLKALESNGYRVTAVATAKEALDVFNREGGRLDMILSDVILPDRNGVDLVDALLSARPGMRVLFVSGHIDREPLMCRIAEKSRPFLRKPYTLEELLAAVRDALVHVS